MLATYLICPIVLSSGILSSKLNERADKPAEKKTQSKSIYMLKCHIISTKKMSCLMTTPRVLIAFAYIKAIKVVND